MLFVDMQIRNSTQLNDYFLLSCNFMTCAWIFNLTVKLFPIFLYMVQLSTQIITLIWYRRWGCTLWYYMCIYIEFCLFKFQWVHWWILVVTTSKAGIALLTNQAWEIYWAIYWPWWCIWKVLHSDKHAMHFTLILVLILVDIIIIFKRII